jgi:hypothetical protein
MRGVVGRPYLYSAQLGRTGAPRLKSGQTNLKVFLIRRRREAPDSKLNKYSTNFRKIQNYCIKSNNQIRKVLLQTQEGCKGLSLCIPSS